MSSGEDGLGGDLHQDDHGHVRRRLLDHRGQWGEDKEGVPGTRGEARVQFKVRSSYMFVGCLA